MKGLFISFEGIDGSGKSTQARNLAETIATETNVPCVYLREPGGTEICEKMRSILKAGGVLPRAELLLFCAARAQLVDEAIVPYLEKGGVVIADRYIDSTVAYQAFGSGLDLVTVQSIIGFATVGLKPDATFFLDCPVKVAEGRAQDAVNRELDKWDEAGSELVARIVAGYAYCRAQDPGRFIEMDASRSIDDIGQDIFAKAKHLMQERSLL